MYFERVNLKFRVCTMDPDMGTCIVVHHYRRPSCMRTRPKCESRKADFWGYSASQAATVTQHFVYNLPLVLISFIIPKLLN
jgi:hypothetical protein